jgi:ketosteroid isomerase-like protein
MTAADRNRRHVLECLEAFATWNPESYESYLTDEPWVRVGHEVHTGRDALRRLAAAGARLFPDGVEILVVSSVAQGDQVGVDVRVRAVTTSGAQYENLHGMVFELDAAGRVARAFDHSDTAHAIDALGLPAPGLPEADLAFDPVPRNVQTTIAFFSAFLSWEPAQYERYLTDDPTYQGGRTVLRGRDGFRSIAALGRHLYPNGLDWEFESIFGEAQRTFLRMVVRAVPNRGIPYENHYAMSFDFADDGRISSQREYTDTAYARERFDYPTGRLT